MKREKENGATDRMSKRHIQAALFTLFLASVDLNQGNSIPSTPSWCGWTYPSRWAKTPYCQGAAESYKRMNIHRIFLLLCYHYVMCKIQEIMKQHSRGTICLTCAVQLPNCLAVHLLWHICRYSSHCRSVCSCLYVYILRCTVLTINVID